MEGCIGDIGLIILADLIHPIQSNHKSCKPDFITLTLKLRDSIIDLSPCRDARVVTNSYRHVYNYHSAGRTSCFFHDLQNKIYSKSIIELVAKMDVYWSVN